jgi:hypothetical protein
VRLTTLLYFVSNSDKVSNHLEIEEEKGEEERKREKIADTAAQPEIEMMAMRSFSSHKYQLISLRYVLLLSFWHVSLRRDFTIIILYALLVCPIRTADAAHYNILN